MSGGIDNRPKLRFPEFSGEWSNRTIDRVVNVSSGGTPSRTRPDYWNGDIPWVTTSEIDGSTIYEANQSISELGLKESSAKLFPVGTILVAMYGQGQTRGRAGVLGIEAATNQACAALKPKDDKELFSPFLLQSLVGRYDELRDIANDGGQKNLSAGLIKSLSFGYPQLPEQQKIAGFLGVVDAKIEQLTRKKALLEDYKKGCMQKLFTQKLRFKDDNGNDFPDWEGKKLGDVLTIGSGRDYKHLSEGDIPVYGTGGYMLSVNDYLYDGESVCIGRKGTIDNPTFLTGKFWTVDTLFYTHSYQGVLPRFIFAVFQLINWGKYNEASGVPSLSKATIEQITIETPHPDEQQKIADFLSAIDAKISLVADELSAAQDLKKGLLQQMFV